MSRLAHDDEPLGARKAEVKAEKKQKDDESDDDLPWGMLGKFKKESASDKETGARTIGKAGMKMGRRVGMRTRRARTKRSVWSCACGCGGAGTRRRRLCGCGPTWWTSRRTEAW